MRSGNPSPGRKPLRFVAAAIIASACLAQAFPIAHSAQPADLLKDFDRIQLVMANSENRCIFFDTYIAISSQQRSQGLMYIRQLDTYEGMIFLYPKAIQISMWMKNTLISLDMLFFDGSGKIAASHLGAVPLSTDTIKSGVEVNAVLELNAGSVELFGLHENSQIIFPPVLFSKQK
jgi:uncharacterized membrane protein (UPF0127 family)